MLLFLITTIFRLEKQELPACRFVFSNCPVFYRGDISLSCRWAKRAGGGHFTLGFRVFTQVNARDLLYLLCLYRSEGFHHLEALLIAPAGGGEGLETFPTRLWT